jgi:glycosyltransferase involved in cell wall biosynthesis
MIANDELRTAPLPGTGGQVDPSLSVVLPVHNAEATLTGLIHELLEILPDIAPRFEIVVVDDGSTDHTEEILHDFSRCYPQLGVVRHQRRRGNSAAIQTGMARTTGDIVFVQEDATGISASEIRRLWDMRHDQQLIMARAEKPRPPLNPHLLDRLTAWGERLRHAREASGYGGIQMIRRQAVEQMEPLSPDAPIAHVHHAAGPPSHPDFTRLANPSTRAGHVPPRPLAQPE